jgi:hypothetical protein
MAISTSAPMLPGRMTVVVSIKSCSIWSLNAQQAQHHSSLSTPARVQWLIPSSPRKVISPNQLRTFGLFVSDAESAHSYIVTKAATLRDLSGVSTIGAELGSNTIGEVTAGSVYLQGIELTLSRLGCLLSSIFAALAVNLGWRLTFHSLGVLAVEVGVAVAHAMLDCMATWKDHVVDLAHLLGGGDACNGGLSCFSGSGRLLIERLKSSGFE